jgi:hypothetical protein
MFPSLFRHHLIFRLYGKNNPFISPILTKRQFVFENLTSRWMTNEKKIRLQEFPVCAECVFALNCSERTKYPYLIMVPLTKSEQPSFRNKTNLQIIWIFSLKIASIYSLPSFITNILVSFEPCHNFREEEQLIFFPSIHAYFAKYSTLYNLKVHKIEIFFGFDFEICIISFMSRCPTYCT